MQQPTTESTTPASTRKKPSRRWYLLAALLMLGSTALFVVVLMQKAQTLRERIDPMPRFVGPTTPDGFVFNADEPGKYNIFYENLGTLGDRTFDTPRRQIWTTFDTPAMTCTVTRIDSGETTEVRLPGVGEIVDKSKATRDLVVAYDFAGRQGHSAWVFEADRPGAYRIVMRYDEAVNREPGDIKVPPELTRDDQKQMTRDAGKAYEEARREALEQAALAELKPVDVLFAVGPDPTQGGFFELIGLKGAATVLAFGFTFSILITLVTLMLRTGSVTERGELANVRRGFTSEHDA